MPKNGLKSFALHNQTAAAAAASIRPTTGTEAAATDVPVDLAALDPENAARLFLRNALASEELPTFQAAEVNGQQCEFKSVGTEAVPLTETTTVKFRQYYRKIPVYGSLVTVEMEPNNELVAINSALGEPADVDPVATISPAQALEVVRGLAGPDAEPLESVPRLHYYFHQEEQRWHLAYIAENVPKVDRGGRVGPGAALELADYVIDAHSGELLAELPRTQRAHMVSDALDELERQRKLTIWADPSGPSKLYDPVLNVHTYNFGFGDVALRDFRLPGAYVVNPPDPWEPAAVSAHANASEVALFLRQVLSRNNLDNRGGPIVSTINCVYAGESRGREWRNAAWTRNQMIYGQRLVDGKLRSYAVATDVVAHEIFHGVTEKSARLEYRGESGALNESYSDIFGILISNFNELDIGRWNWQMGEDLEGTGLPLRDLSDPTKHRQPAHMRDYRDLPLDRDHDSGGVHTNSGIHNKAAYNVMTAKDAQGAYVFDAKSLAALFYLALTQHLTPTSGFAHSRQALLLVARTLFRKDAARDVKLTAIDEAFEGTGIPLPD